MNHRPVIAHWQRQFRSSLSIVTLRYEGVAHVSDRVRYEFADLRALPYRDQWFSHVICASTLEHIGMSNVIYGVKGRASDDPTGEAVRALRELFRVTQPGGSLLLTVPFGRRSERQWLRVFDGDILERVIAGSGWSHQSSRFFRATLQGWREQTQVDVEDAGYNEPPGRGQQTAPAHVAAAEAVALVEFVRK